MQISEKVKQQILSLCGSMNEDDGIVAREFHDRRRSHRRQRDVQAERLCHRVERILTMTLHESKNEVVQELVVVRVLAARRGTLTVQFDRCGKSDQTCRELLNVLRSHRGWMRSQIAAGIERRLVPNLAFEFVDAASLLNCNGEPHA